MLNNKTPFFSVIIPVYNTQEYICQCLDSILSQTFDNWEAIVVDDGSTDSSSKICDEYSQKDDRIIVLHKKNEGVSTARNCAIEKVRGEWIVFVDSDDYLDKDLLEILYRYITKYDGAELFSYGYRRVSNVGKILSRAHNPDEKKTSALEYIRGWHYQHAGCCYAWNSSVIRRNKLAFNCKFKYAEDQDLLSRYFLSNPDVVLLPFEPYNYRLNDSSATSQKEISMERCEVNLQAARNLITWATDNQQLSSPVLVYLLAEYYDQFITYYYMSMTINKEEGRNLYRKYYDDLCTLYPQFYTLKRFKRFYISEKLFHRYSSGYNRLWIYIRIFKLWLKGKILNRIFPGYFIPYRLEL